MDWCRWKLLGQFHHQSSLPNYNPIVNQEMFQKESFCDFNPNPDNKIVGGGIFYNSTRTQVKEIGDKE